MKRPSFAEILLGILKDESLDGRVAAVSEFQNHLKEKLDPEGERHYWRGYGHGLNKCLKLLQRLLQTLQKAQLDSDLWRSRAKQAEGKAKAYEKLLIERNELVETNHVLQRRILTLEAFSEEP